MTILETELIPLAKIRQFLAALDGLSGGDLGSFRVDDTNGQITVSLSVGNNVSCLGLKSKNAPPSSGVCPLM